MANKYRGSCLCGSVKYELLGEFQSFFLCHCTRCQKGTGSAHGANLFSKAGTLTWLNGESDVRTYKHPNSFHAKSFCSKCGSVIPTFAESTNSVVVPAGSLDSPVPIPPTAKIFIGSSAKWSMKLFDVPSYEKLPEQAKS